MKLIEEPANVSDPSNGLVIRRVDCKDLLTGEVVRQYSRLSVL